MPRRAEIVPEIPAREAVVPLNDFNGLVRTRYRIGTGAILAAGAAHFQPRPKARHSELGTRARNSGTAETTRCSTSDLKATGKTTRCRVWAEPRSCPSTGFPFPS
jgi:hypothetical protein